MGGGGGLSSHDLQWGGNKGRHSARARPACQAVPRHQCVLPLHLRVSGKRTSLRILNKNNFIFIRISELSSIQHPPPSIPFSSLNAGSTPNFSFLLAEVPRPAAHAASRLTAPTPQLRLYPLHNAVHVKGMPALPPHRRAVIPCASHTSVSAPSLSLRLSLSFSLRSPGVLHSTQQPSKGRRQMPQSSSLRSHRHLPTPPHLTTFTFIFVL